MDAEKSRIRAEATARHVPLAAVAALAVGALLVAISPSKIGIISNNAVTASSLHPAIVAQQAYGA